MEIYSDKKQEVNLPRFVTLAGLIGAGKTTLADALGKAISETFRSKFIIMRK